MERIEDLVNRAIEADLEVFEEFWSFDQAKGNFDLSRLPEGSGETVRIVKTGDFDLCPCIGPHVESTGRFGRFTITTHDCNDGVLRLRFKLLPAKDRAGSTQDCSSS